MGQQPDGQAAVPLKHDLEPPEEVEQRALALREGRLDGLLRVHPV